MQHFYLNLGRRRNDSEYRDVAPLTKQLKIGAVFNLVS